MQTLEEQLLKHHAENQESFELVGEDVDAIRASTAQIEARLASSDARMERRSIELQDAILSINNQLRNLQLQNTSSLYSSRTASTGTDANSQSNSRKGEPHGQVNRDRQKLKADRPVHKER